MSPFPSVPSLARFGFSRARLTVALLATAAGLLTLMLAAGPSRAQNPPSEYGDPPPCGPGANAAFQPEPHEITEGHFALFDAYWEVTEPDPSETTDLDSPPENTGILHTNTCPPKVEITKVDDGLGGTTIVKSLVKSHIDIDEAIFHILDGHSTTVADGGPDDDDYSHARLDHYPELADYTGVGEQVWWLRLDDPGTPGVDETSDLTVGFSTMRFDSQDWARDEGGPAFHYKFELERHPGIDPADHPHMLVYKARQQGLPAAKLLWDSAEPDDDEHDVALHPGQLEDLQWIFTKPGTYIISVHMKGFVRQAGNPQLDAPRGWMPISGNRTVAETSEVKQYVFQVGDTLVEVEPPSFGVSFSVDAAPVAGDSIGSPIQVIGKDSRVSLQYSLSGTGAEHFSLVSLSDPDRVQIVVADGVTLNPGKQRSYELTLGVTDGVDHEDNFDDSLDHTLAVEIELTYPSLVLTFKPPNPRVDEIVTVTAHVGNFGEGEQLTFHWSDDAGTNYDGEDTSILEVVHTGAPATLNISAYVTFVPEGGDPNTDTRRLDAQGPVSVSWHR